MLLQLSCCDMIKIMTRTHKNCTAAKCEVSWADYIVHDVRGYTYRPIYWAGVLVQRNLIRYHRVHCGMSELQGSAWNQSHDDVIKWKHFPRYWPFVRGIQRFPVISLHKTSDAELLCFLWSAWPLNKRLSKQSRGWWFGTLSRPLWRLGND